jgi:DNA-binding transcriptional LysR family regulator
MDYRWDDVRVFLGVWRHRTFSAAAKELGVEVSTVSRRLGAFEESLGVHLFDRTADGLLPTAAAEEMVAAAERAESAAREVARTAGGLERTPTGQVRITTLPGLAETFLAPVLPQLMAQHPGLRITVLVSQQIVDLTRNEADLAMRTVRPQSGDLVVQKLGASPYVLVASPALAGRLGTVGSLEALRGVPLVGWTPEFSMIPPARWMARHLAGVEPVMQSNSMAVQFRAAGAGAGLALLPVAFMSQVDGLVEVPVTRAFREQHPFPSDELWMVVHRALRQVPRVQCVWDFVLKHMKDHPMGQARS